MPIGLVVPVVLVGWATACALTSWRRLDRMLPSPCHEDQIVNLGLMATDFPQYRLSFDRPE
jgi:hypothetical protein